MDQPLRSNSSYNFDDLTDGVDAAQLTKHWSRLYADLTIPGGGAIAVKSVRPQGRFETHTNKLTGEITEREEVYHYHEWVHVGRGRDAEDLASFVATVQRTAKKYPKIQVALNPRTAEAFDRGAYNVANDLIACVVTTRVDLDTIDGNHYETNLPTREQVAALALTCPAGPPSLRTATGGGEHWDYIHNPVLTEIEARGFNDRLAEWFLQTGESSGLHLADVDVTRDPTKVSRFAGTVHGKVGPREHKTLTVIGEGADLDATKVADLLPESRATIAARAKAEREAVRAAAGPRSVSSVALDGAAGNSETWVQFALRMPVDRILEDVMWMCPSSDDDDEEDVTWRWSDDPRGPGSIRTRPGMEGEAARSMTIYGASTAVQFGLTGNGGYTSWSLLKTLFCDGDGRLAGAVARKYLADDIEDVIDWMQERWSAAEGRLLTVEELLVEEPVEEDDPFAGMSVADLMAGV